MSSPPKQTYHLIENILATVLINATETIISGDDAWNRSRISKRTYEKYHELVPLEEVIYKKCHALVFDVESACFL